MVRSALMAVARSAWKASSAGVTVGDALSRYAMYKAIEAEPGARIAEGPVLSISHSLNLARRLSAPGVDFVEANYPNQKINALQFDDNTFSAVVSDQVLEHVECTPTDAIDEVWRVLKPGGLSIHTTCFLIPYHGADRIDDLENGDFWRFTPSGLARLHKRYSEVIAANGAGHPLEPLFGYLGLGWMKVPEARWHPLNRLAMMNRRSYASTVWVIARK